MKTQGILFAMLFCFLLGSASAQDIKTNSKTEVANIDKLGTLLDSKTFEFVATRAFPTTGTPKNLAGSSYSVTFSPEVIISTLPFYGRAYSGIGMDEDKGMRFKGKPENFIIKSKKGYQLNTTVKDGDTYNISLSVNDSGYARLTISSNDRETISYQGEIVSVE